jgi:hypothetical protein
MNGTSEELLSEILSKQTPWKTARSKEQERIFGDRFESSGRAASDPCHRIQHGRGLSQDVSTDVAQELRRRCDLQLRDVPTVVDFVECHEGHDRQQLTLRLV